MTWCLIQSQANRFLKGLQSGEIDPFKLADMASVDRHTYLSKFVGEENATQVNSLFESKLLLKDQQRGMITWAKKVGNLTPEVRRDLISRIGKLDKILDPEDQTKFLKDLASTKVGVEINPDQAKNILDLSSKVKDLESSIPATTERKAGGIEGGRAKVALGNYVNDLKNKVNKFSLNPINAAKELPGVTKSIRASMDNSAIFRQGWKTLMTHPGTWLKNATRSFSDIVKTFGGKKVMDEITADIISRPNYDRMVTGKLAVSTIEEAYPSSLPEKIPVLGRAYKATETAYTGFVHRQRADIFDKYLQIAQKSGLDINGPKELRSIASMVNSLTGRGDLGKFEGSGANLVNNVFFSPRFVKAQVDTLLHPLTGAGGSNFVRRQAAINLVKVIAGTAGVIAIAHAVKPGSVETNPRSSDFGKIKVGDTRFDVTGGMSSLVTLAARLATMSTKSNVTGEIKPLNSGKFGQPTGTDVIVNFLENKLSPVLSVVKDITSGKDFNGNKVTLGGELSNLFVPLSVSTYQELKSDPNSAPVLLAMIADGLGINTNTYVPKSQTKDWNTNSSKTLTQFRTKAGDKKFQAANDKFNTQYQSWLTNTSKKSSYQNLSQSDKVKVQTQAKKAIQAKVLKSYGFTYKQGKPNRNIKNLKPK